MNETLRDTTDWLELKIRTMQISLESIIPHINNTYEEYTVKYRVVKKSSYDIISPYHINDACICIRKDRGDWIITATCINGTKIEEKESFKLTIPRSSCADLVTITRMYTTAWVEQRRVLYEEAAKYLHHCYRLHQKSSSCSTD